MLTKEQEKLAREEVFKITGIKNFKSITQNILLDEMTNMLVCFNYTESLKQLHSGNFTELATTNTSSFENAKRINRLLHHKGDGIYILIVNTQDSVLSYTTSLRNMLDFYLDGAISKDNRFYFRANVEDAVNKKETLSLHTCSHKNKCIYINLFTKISTMEENFNHTTATVFDKIRENKEEARIVKLSLDELNSLSHSNGQRCGITAEEDVNHRYHPLEHQQFDERVQNTMKSIIKEGWKDDLLAFRFALCKDDNKFYITDGQSTKAACNLINANPSSSVTLPQKFSCIFEGYKTLEEIDGHTYDMNGGTHKKVWNASDNVAAVLRRDGGKPYADFLKIKDFQLETKTGETAVSYVFVGDYIKRSTKAEDFKLREYYELYTDFYRDFVTNAGKVYVDANLISEDKRVGRYRSRHNATRSEGMAKHLSQSIDLCLHICNIHNLNPHTYIPIYGRKLMSEVFNNAGMKVEKWNDIMMTPKSDFVGFASKCNLCTVIGETFKGRVLPPSYRTDYKNFLAKKFVESKMKF